MACSLYNNCGYGCGGCTHFVKTNSVTLADSVLILNIPQATYSNKEKVCICIAQAIPEVTSADTVAITIGDGTTQYVLRTKQLYEEVWQECINYGMTADAEYISDLVEDVTKEIKKINRMCEQLNGTGYDSVAIHNMQDKYHEKYKKKYNEEYTDKEVRKLKEQNKRK